MIENFMWFYLCILIFFLFLLFQRQSIIHHENSLLPAFHAVMTCQIPHGVSVNLKLTSKCKNGQTARRSSSVYILKFTEISDRPCLWLSPGKCWSHVASLGLDSIQRGGEKRKKKKKKKKKRGNRKRGTAG